MNNPICGASKRIYNSASISPIEMKGMLRSASYLTGGLPVNGLYKLHRLLEEPVEEATNIIKKEAERLSDNINDFIERFKDNPDRNTQDFIKESVSYALPGSYLKCGYY